MKRDTIKDVLYGGVIELMKDSNYFYRSGVLEYSTWNEEGRKAVMDFVEVISISILKEEDRMLDARAKQMVLDELKGKN